MTALFDAEAFIRATPESGIYERQLRQQLDHLPRPYRAAFAAACAERLTPWSLKAGISADGDGEQLGICLDVVWESALHGSLRQPWLDALLRSCRAQLATAVDSPLRAILACLETAQTGGAEDAVRTSQYVGRAWCEFERRDRGDTSLHRSLPPFHLLLERRRQCRDLSELHKTAATPSPNVVGRLRDRAMTEAARIEDDPEEPRTGPRRQAGGH
ncbi:MAG: hypothetical protein P4L83_13015 [Nevskia sp.]|nr:hypothetical protein [Nevskia sp.]